MSLSFYRLRVLCEVVEQQSFSKAAERLVVTQPVVSHTVRELERHFGGRLVDRRGRSVVPTDIGLSVYRFAREVLQASSEAEQLVSELVRGDRGTITIGLSTAIGSYTFPVVWQRFWQTHPRVQPILRLADSQRIVEETRDGILDVGLALSMPVPEGVLSESLGYVELVLVASPQCANSGRALTPGELAGKTFLCTNGLSYYENLLADLRSWGIESSCRVVRFGDTETVKRGVEANLGFAQLTRPAVARELAAGSLAALDVGVQLQRELLLVQPLKHSRSTSLVRETIDFLRSEAAALCGLQASGRLGQSGGQLNACSLSG